MKLTVKIILPIILLLFILLCTFSYIIYQLRLEEHLILEDSQKIQKLNSLDTQLNKEQSLVDLAVFSYLYMHNPLFLDNITKAEIEKSKILDDMSPRIGSLQGKDLFKKYNVDRLIGDQLRSDLLVSVGSGNATDSTIKYNKWYKQAQARNAALADLSAFNSNTLEKTLVSIEQIRQRITFVVISLGVLLIILISMLYFYLRWVLVVPIIRLVKTTAQITNLDFSPAYINTAKDEIGELARSFSVMGSALKDYYEKLETKVAERTLDLQKFKLAVEDAYDHILIADNEGIVIYVNPAAERITGFSENEILGKKAGELWGSLMEESYYGRLWETIKRDKKVYVGIVLNKRKNGEMYKSEIHVSPIFDEHKNPLFFVFIERDVTKEKEVELTKENASKATMNVLEDLEEAHKMLEVEKSKDEAMLDSMGEGMIAVDNDSRIMVVNKVALTMLGYEMKNLIGAKITDLPLADEAGNSIPISKRPATIALSTGHIIKAMYYFVRKDKTRFPVAINVTPIILNGKTIGLVEIIRDITRERAIDRAKSEFVSIASHQLRTPLGITKWYLEAMSTDEYLKTSPKNFKEYFDVVWKNNERVLALVRELLSVSRIEQGKVKDDPKSIDLKEAITDVVKEMQAIAQKKDVNLTLQVETEALPNFLIDRLRFHEVVENLIANALEYTTAHGIVEIILKKDATNMRISVKDTGIGMSSRDQEKLFTKFFRSENAITKNPEGSGLGLYVVKSYIEAWGGTIAVESSEGVGSTFTITLPIKNTERKTNPPVLGG